MIMDLKREGEIDRVSSLPDSVLVHILSCLPTKDAAKTMLLRPFHDLWTYVHTLDFDSYHLREHRYFDYYFTKERRYIRFVNCFLLRHQNTTIHKFRLKYLDHDRGDNLYFWDDDEYYPIDQVTQVQKWIGFALARRVGILDLDLGVICKYFSMPDGAWISNSIVELHLTNCHIRVPDTVQMVSLRVLKLYRVEYLSDKMMSRIINKCPLLQDVSLIDCMEPWDFSFTAQNVWKLRVCHTNIDDTLHTWKRYIDCPQLRSFEFSGFLHYVELLDLSSIKIVTLNLSFEYLDEFREEAYYVKFLQKIQLTEVFKLNTAAFAALTYGVVRDNPCLPNKWKRVVLDTSMKDKYLLGICSLLRYSSCLEELIINISLPCEELPKDMQSELDDSVPELEDICGSKFVIKNLKFVTFRCLLQNPDVTHLKLVNIILKNAEVLEKVYIQSKRDPQRAHKYLSATQRHRSKRKLDGVQRSLQLTKIFIL